MEKPTAPRRPLPPQISRETERLFKKYSINLKNQEDELKISTLIKKEIDLVAKKLADPNLESKNLQLLAIQLNAVSTLSTTLKSVCIRFQSYRSKMELYQQEYKKYLIDLQMYTAWKLREQQENLTERLKKTENELKTIKERLSSLQNEIIDVNRD